MMLVDDSHMDKDHDNIDQAGSYYAESYTYQHHQQKMVHHNTPSLPAGPNMSRTPAARFAPLVANSWALGARRPRCTGPQRHFAKGLITGGEVLTYPVVRFLGTPAGNSGRPPGSYKQYGNG